MQTPSTHRDQQESKIIKIKRSQFTCIRQLTACYTGKSGKGPTKQEGYLPQHNNSHSTISSNAKHSTPNDILKEEKSS
jgi:hypothetical protein